MQNYSQNGVLSGLEPGSRVKSALEKIRGESPDMSQAADVIPNNPGPAAAGRTPAIGQVRRDRDMPVIRDQVPSLLD